MLTSSHRAAIRVLIGGLAAAALAISAGCGSADGIVRTAIPGISGKADFDAIGLDGPAHRLYLADRAKQSLDIIDTAAQPPAFIASVDLRGKPNGIAVAPDLHKVYAGLANGTVAVVDVEASSRTAGSVTQRIATAAKEIDLMDYDPVAHVVYAAAPKEGVLLGIDPLRDTVSARITLKGGLEQPRGDGAHHRVLVVDAATNSLYDVDTEHGNRVTAHPLGRTCAPRGLAISNHGDLALIGCSDPHAGQVLSWDVGSARVLDSFPQVANIDLIVHDAGSNRWFAAGTLGGHTGVAILGGQPLRFLSSLQTHADTGSVAYDSQHDRVFQADAHAGEAGVLSFKPPAAALTAPWWSTPLLLLLPLLVIGAVIVFFGRRAARRRVAAGRPIFS